MSKKCSRCEKTVYPLEELKCLDKIWHKACFKCQECNMALNMRTYKGFNRLPYCNAHCPQAKHTTVADTPEIRRIQENTKLQSTVKYHEEFEKQKGKVTQIADDPETLRIRANTRIISNVTYHGDLEKKASMEQRRPAAATNRNGDGGYDDDDDDDYVSNDPSPISQLAPSQPPPPIQISRQQEQPPILPPESSSIIMSNPVASRNQPSSVVVPPPSTNQVQNQSRRIGSIADYDPINDNYGSLGRSSSGGGGGNANRTSSSSAAANRNSNSSNNSDYSMMNTQTQMGRGVAEEEPMAPPPVQKVGATYLAMYDYSAADVDEVSFLDGDVILNCTPIDEGWMTGTVQRTGHTGMLPANYVQPIN